MGGIFNNSYDGRNRDYGVPNHPKGTVGGAILAEKSLKDGKAGDKRSVILPTVLRVTTEEIQYWTNMTCFYDKYWTFEPNFSTVPISFMHITSVAETITAQGAEKRVIVYEAPESLNKAVGFDAERHSHPGYKNNLEVIMDNVVVQPKQYQMEVIIPDSLIGPFHKQGLARLDALMNYMTETDVSVDVNYGFGKGDLVKGIGDTLRSAQVFLGAVEKTANLADLILGAGGGSSQMATINKNSLEAMAKKGRVVLFKKWTGYDYSYGIITKVDIAKKPTEDGVYRGSITFQEAPILNISQKKVSASSSFIGGLRAGAASKARYVNLALAFPFIKMTGVMDEAGAPGSPDNKTTRMPGQSLEIF